MSKYEGGILSIALAKLASGELQREELELERREAEFDEMVWRHVDVSSGLYDESHRRSIEDYFFTNQQRTTNMAKKIRIPKRRSPRM